MSNVKVNYKVNKRVSHNVDHEYDIVFDRCNPIIDGVKQNYEQLLMRYTKNDKTVNNSPAFNEIDMMKAIVKLFGSSAISDEAKEILRKGIK